MQYKPHTAALITACAILTAMPATAAVQINKWVSCGGEGEAACSDYSSGVVFLPVAEGGPMLWLQMPLLRSAETLH